MREDMGQGDDRQKNKNMSGTVCAHPRLSTAEP